MSYTALYVRLPKDYNGHLVRCVRGGHGIKPMTLQLFHSLPHLKVRPHLKNRQGNVLCLPSSAWGACGVLRVACRFVSSENHAKY
jgi:hypothetical protein